MPRGTDVPRSGGVGTEEIRGFIGDRLTCHSFVRFACLDSNVCSILGTIFLLLLAEKRERVAAVHRMYEKHVGDDILRRRERLFRICGLVDLGKRTRFMTCLHVHVF